VDVETVSLANYVHMRCVDCTVFRRFKEEAAAGDLMLPVINSGKGMPALFARVVKYAMMRGCSFG
jgi:hypothetical protein